MGDCHSRQMFSLCTFGGPSRLMLLFPPSFVIHGQACPLLIGGHSMGAGQQYSAGSREIMGTSAFLKRAMLVSEGFVSVSTSFQNVMSQAVKLQAHIQRSVKGAFLVTVQDITRHYT